MWAVATLENEKRLDALCVVDRGYPQASGQTSSLDGFSFSPLRKICYVLRAGHDAMYPLDAYLFNIQARATVAQWLPRPLSRLHTSQLARRDAYLSLTASAPRLSDL